jgi:hypothetical protein
MQNLAFTYRQWISGNRKPRGTVRRCCTLYIGARHGQAVQHCSFMERGYQIAIDPAPAVYSQLKRDRAVSLGDIRTGHH